MIVTLLLLLQSADLPALKPDGRCGTFQGERRCTKAEALDYGYGGGGDPVSVLTKIVGKITGQEIDRGK